MISLETLGLHLSSYSHSKQWQPEQEVIKAQELILLSFLGSFIEPNIQFITWLLN